MKIASCRWNLLGLAALALALGGCGHKHSGAVGQTTPTPTGSVPWAWLGGSDVVGRSGVYPPSSGTLLIPGSRDSAANWIDSKGNLWLFGGVGFDVSGTAGSMNDLWEYNGTQWTFIGGSTKVGATGVYNLLNTGIPLSQPSPTTPGARSGAAFWIDASDNLWLFGGLGQDSTGLQGNLNDLWEFMPATGVWVWRGGSLNANARGTYAAVGTNPAVPGAREGSVTWTDASGNFWLFGGGGYDSAGNNGLLADLWQYSPATGLWTFNDIATGTAGTTTVAGVYPSYGTKGTAAATNVPGARQSAAGWVDAAGTLWLFGGRGYDTNKSNGFLGDVWKYLPSTKQWTWYAGSNAVNAFGVYGTLATPASGNGPGARAGAATVRDSAGNFWLFGGQGYDGSGNQGYLNDLWQFNVSSGQWQYVSGSTVVNALGSYPTAPTATGALTYAPGARYNAALWIDPSSNLWVFGGGGYDANSLLGDLNDLWKVPVKP